MSLHGHRTSIALETEFWSVIDREIDHRDMSLAAFIALIDDERVLSKSEYGLASYLRVWVVKKLINNQAIGSTGA